LRKCVKKKNRIKNGRVIQPMGRSSKCVEKNKKQKNKNKNSGTQTKMKISLINKPNNNNQ
jgi:hypothetical protein